MRRTLFCVRIVNVELTRQSREFLMSIIGNQKYQKSSSFSLQEELDCEGYFQPSQGQVLSDGENLPIGWGRLEEDLLLSPADRQEVLEEEKVTPARRFLLREISSHPGISRAELRSRLGAYIMIRDFFRKYPDRILPQWELTPSCLVRAGIRWREQLEAFFSLWEKLARPDRNWRSSKQVPLSLVVRLIPYDQLPDWTLSVLLWTNNIPGRCLERFDRLIQAAKAWKVCPDLPKRIAVRIGQKPFWKRLAATAAWRQTHWMSAQTHWISPAERQNEFWARYNELVRDGRHRSVEAYVNVAGGAGGVLAIKRAVSALVSGLPEAYAGALVEILHDLWGEMDDTGRLHPVHILAGFKPSAWKQALKAAEWEPPSDRSSRWQRRMGWQEKPCLALALIFGKQSTQWIASQKKMGRSLHDGIYWMPFLLGEDASSFKAWLFRHKKSDIRRLEIAGNAWASLSQEERQLSPKKLEQIIRSRTYSGVHNTDFAAECAKWGISQEDFSRFQERWISSLKTPNPFPTKTWEKGGMVGRFLHRGDPRGLFLGQYVYCCQHPKGIGHQCAWYGQESPKSGFFVVEQHGEIVAMSWVWQTQDGLCFDNVEALSLGSRMDAVVSVYRQAAQCLSRSRRQVMVGTGTTDLDLSSFEPASTLLPLPRDYSGYSDATSSQKVMAFNPAIAPGASPIGDTYVRGLLDDDLDRLEEIACDVYPSGWRFAGTEDSDEGLVLVSQGEIVGYTTIESEARYISDMAVLPQYRKHSLALVRALFARCHGDGEWTATCRQSTSMRLMEAFARRGKIKIISRSPAGEMGDEPMTDIRFVVLR